MKTYSIIISTLLLALSITSCKEMKANDKEIDKKVYLQLYSVRDDIQKDFDTTIEAVAKIGYAGIEAANYADGLFYGLTPTEFKDKLNALNLEVLSSHTTYSLAKNIDETDWDAVWKWWDEAIVAHKEAGMKYIVIPWMNKPETLNELAQYCDYYNKIGEKCNDAGIRLGYHNHHFEFTEIEGVLMYDYMLENTDADKLFFQMDVYWTVVGGKSPVEYFKNYPGRFEMLHIKDQKELGESGMVGFDAIFKNAELANAQYMVVEVENYNYSPIESVERSYNYLQGADFYQADFSK